MGSSSVRAPSTQLSDATLFAALASEGSSTLWKPSIVKKPGMPSSIDLPEARTNTPTPAAPSASRGRHGGTRWAAADGRMRE